MIVDQLRCGGVLEAVRVSRAGYPTRYPHNVFKARYYILGDAMDTKPVSPIKRWGRGATMNKEDTEIKRLVSKIAFDIWEADHQALLAALEEDDIPFLVSFHTLSVLLMHQNRQSFMFSTTLCLIRHRIARVTCLRTMPLT